MPAFIRNILETIENIYLLRRRKASASGRSIFSEDIICYIYESI